MSVRERLKLRGLIDLRYKGDRATKSVMAQNDILVHALAQKAVDFP